MRGRRPYPIPGVKPGRWQVHKMRGLPKTARPGWYVQREHCGGGVSFPTWREAQDYADRQTRTREVVLPRLTPLAVEALSQKRFMPYAPEHAETFALSMLAYKELAIAEQEEHA